MYHLKEEYRRNKMNSFKDRTKIYYDAEFTGLYRNAHLISIAFISESGAYFYAECPWYVYDKNKSKWIDDNVIPNLLFNDKDDHYIEDPTEIIDDNGHRHLNMKLKGGPIFIDKYLTQWFELEYMANDKKKIQLYTDCYAYDWMLLMDLICPECDALNLIDWIDYIPIDLSTMLFMNNIDPDTKREKLVGKLFIDAMIMREPFINMLDPKHNALWDAYIMSEIFMRLFAKDKLEENTEEKKEETENKDNELDDDLG